MPALPRRLTGAAARTGARLRHGRLAAADRGAAEVLFAVGFVVLLMLLPLVWDGSRALNERSRMFRVADEAARAAGQEIDAARAIAGEGVVMGPRAEAAARSYLQAEGATGSVRVSADRLHVTVTAHSTYRTQLAGLLGWNNSPIDGSSSATVLQEHQD